MWKSCHHFGQQGSIALNANERVAVDADKTVKVVDTTAGDLYAAGYLFGRQRGDGLQRSAELATIAATELSSYRGTSFDNLAEKARF